MRSTAGRRPPERIVRASLRRPGAVFAAWLAVAALAAPGVLRLDVDTSTDSVLERSDRLWHFYQESQASFGGDEIIVVALENDTPLAPPALRAIAELTSALEEHRGCPPGGQPGQRAADPRRTRRRPRPRRRPGRRHSADAPRGGRTSPASCDAIASLRAPSSRRTGGSCR